MSLKEYFFFRKINEIMQIAKSNNLNEITTNLK